MTLGRQLRLDMDDRIAAVLATKLSSLQRGIVTEVQDGVDGRGGTATVRLGGGADESPDISWYGIRPAVDDVVYVELPPPGGTRRIAYIDSELVLGDDTDDVSFEHDLLAHEGMGLVSTVTFDEHVVNTSHLFTWNTPNTLTVDSGKWSLMATGTIDQRYGEVVFEADIGGAGSNGATWTRGRLRGRIRQQSDFATNPLVALEMLDPGDLAAADLSLVVTSNAGPTSFGLYIRVTREYEWATWTPTRTYVRPDYAAFAWVGCQAFVAALPAGTQYVAVASSSGGGTTAHGGLTGLTTGDDHTQYLQESLLTTQGDLPYATAASTWARLPKGTEYQFLRMNAGATAPMWTSMLPYHAALHSTTAQSMTSSGSLAKLTFTNASVQSDPHSMLVAANDELAVTVAGTYLITASVAWTANTTGARRATVRVNGVNTLYAGPITPATTSQETGLTITAALKLAAADTLQVWAAQSSGGLLDVISKSLAVLRLNA